MNVFLINMLTLPIYKILIRNRKLFNFVVGVQLFLILALRADSYGDDLDVYKSVYSSMGDYTFLDVILNFKIFTSSPLAYGMESGYVFLNWIFFNLHFSFKGFLLIHDLVCICSLMFFINKYSKSPLLSITFVLVFYYDFLFGILRQTFATSILLWTVPLIKRKKPVKFFVFVFIATLLHRISLVFIPVYFLAKIKVTKISIFNTLFISLLIMVFLPVIFNKVINPLLNSAARPYELETYKFNTLLVCLVALLIFVVLIWRKKSFNKHAENVIATRVCCLAILAQAIASYIPIFGRVTLCLFIPFIAILIANAIYSGFNKSTRNFIENLLYCTLFTYYSFMQIGKQPYLLHWKRI